MVRSDARPSLVWLRDDLRIADNPALRFAAENGPMVVCFVLDERSRGIRPYGAAARWWLHHSLLSLAEDLEERGVRLVLRRGGAEQMIRGLAEELDAGAVLWNRRYGAPERAVDTAVKQGLRDDGRDARSFHGSLLYEPWTVTTASGGPYSVFTPFWRSCQKREPPRPPFPEPPVFDGSAPNVRSDALNSWELLPTVPDWAAGLRERWEPGEAAGTRRLRSFVAERIDGYAEGRDRPAEAATSSLSPHLRWGEVSPFQLWHAVDSARHGAHDDANAAKFLAELGWREFCAQLHFHWPDLATQNFDTRFDAFPWREPLAEEMAAWRRGRTGFPLVDAGMRELWRTGHMHNRVRMVVASFLIKNMLVDWRVGERWFWDTLVDADAASNAANWQWVAGSGADASPYFRIFNPITQSETFDPDAAYIRANVPELADAERAIAHQPWRAANTLLDRTDYPERILDLGETRARALDAFATIKGRPRNTAR